jgi:hypothetical protein
LLSFLRPDATYTNRVVEKAIRSVFEDGMPFSRVPERLARDFWVQPSEAIIRRWCRAYTKSLPITEKYEPWVVASFSGILCIDEVYQDKLALLLAVDPAATNKGDRLVGYALAHGEVAQKDIADFLLRLRKIGIEPDEVITDGSTLYPELITKIWPKAVHQLCLFHETRNRTKALLKAVQELRVSLPKEPRQAKSTGRPLLQKHPGIEPGLERKLRVAQVHQLRNEGASIKELGRKTGHSLNTIRAWLKEKPAAHLMTESLSPLPAILNIMQDAKLSPPAPWSNWEQVRHVSEQLKESRFLFARREKNLTDEEQQRLNELSLSPVGDSVRILREFMAGWYEIWHDENGSRRSWEAARTCYLELGKQEQFRNSRYLRPVSERMTEKHFEPLGQFLKVSEFEATNNGAERMGRTYRHLQASQFELRSTESREGALKAYMIKTKECIEKKQVPHSNRGRKPKPMRAEVKV